MDQTLEGARSALAAEWASRSPSSPSEIRAFYRDSRAVRIDLEAWHQTRERRLMTAVIASVAQQIKAKSFVDVGAGIGTDLRLLRKAGVPDVAGVEPNTELRRALEHDGIRCHEDIAAAPIEQADLVTLIDVLEHVPDPDTFLGEIARRMRAGGAKPGAVLIETCSTHDTKLPLHLAENRGWHPGRTLEHYGFTIIQLVGNIRIWQRGQATRATTGTAIICCAYRTLTIPTFTSIQRLVNRPNSWRVMTKTGDALVSRARSIVASRWLMETDDDVFLMIDDDIVFEPEVAEQVVELAREHDIACAAYPVRDGKHLALRDLSGPLANMDFGPDVAPYEIQYAATGFMAVHRRVLEAMRKTLVLCDETTTWAFWPFFMPMIIELDGSMVYLSEDWAFCERARALGFKVYVEPRVRIGHLATLELNVGNMSGVAKALAEGFDGMA